MDGRHTIIVMPPGSASLDVPNHLIRVGRSRRRSNSLELQRRGAMQIIYRGNLKEKKATAFRDWWMSNRDAFEENAPPGWSYAGTYFTVFGFGKFDVETRWDLTSYGSLDSARDHENEIWDRLNLEIIEFIEPTIPGETYLMRSAEDVKILE